MLAVQPMIEKSADRNQLHQFGEAADMVDVVMRRQQIVDAAQSFRFQRGGDALGIADRLVAEARRPAAVDHQRFVVGGDEQRAARPFEIELDDAQAVRGGSRLCRPRQQRCGQNRTKLHGAPLSTENTYSVTDWKVCPGRSTVVGKSGLLGLSG